jgi:hypothetical protein
MLVGGSTPTPMPTSNPMNFNGYYYQYYYGDKNNCNGVGDISGQLLNFCSYEDENSYIIYECDGSKYYIFLFGPHYTLSNYNFPSNSFLEVLL